MPPSSPLRLWPEKQWSSRSDHPYPGPEGWDEADFEPAERVSQKIVQRAHNERPLPGRCVLERWIHHPAELIPTMLAAASRQLGGWDRWSQQDFEPAYQLWMRGVREARAQQLLWTPLLNHASRTRLEQRIADPKQRQYATDLHTHQLEQLQPWLETLEDFPQAFQLLEFQNKNLLWQVVEHLNPALLRGKLLEEIRELGRGTWNDLLLSRLAYRSKLQPRQLQNLLGDNPEQLPRPVLRNIALHPQATSAVQQRAIYHFPWEQAQPVNWKAFPGRDRIADFATAHFLIREAPWWMVRHLWGRPRPRWPKLLRLTLREFPHQLSRWIVEAGPPEWLQTPDQQTTFFKILLGHRLVGPQRTGQLLRQVGMLQKPPT